ncbi:MAG TPA: hypothetical protein VMT85_24495 [Thermoanaerobaculia bacterium]|nr:hypothetical protein [Thermoanaerobaculia bacterium]
MAITIAAPAAPRPYEDDKLRVDVPEGWLARPAKMGGVPGVTLTNVPEAELVAIEEAKRTVGPGEVIVHIMEVGAMGPSAAEAYGLTPASNGEDYVEGYARLYRSGRPGLRATKPTTVRIGGKKLAFTEAELDRFQYTLRQYGWEEYAIGVTTHRGEADRFEASIRAILSSLERRRAEEDP